MFYLSKEQYILNSDLKHLCERVCTCKRAYILSRPTLIKGPHLSVREMLHYNFEII